MTLHVPLEDFAATVKRMFKHSEAFVSVHGSGSVATASVVDQDTLVVSVTKEQPSDVRAMLEKAGMTVSTGAWSALDELPTEEVSISQAYVAAVAYSSSEQKSGIWVDAFPTLPTQVQALRAMYEEFRETGEMEDVSFEEFVKHANPNVVIVSPAELQSFLNQKDGC